MKCNKVKNPCKICFQSVTKKNGIQCQGACQKWAHFKCLNFTPGKIQDIKAGVIRITCPCPDCNTTVPKEVLTDPPFTCTNTQCPANKLPGCSSVECPSNSNSVENPILISPSPFESSSVRSFERCSPRRTCPPPRSPPCPPPRSPPCPPPRPPPCPPPRSPPCPPLRSSPCPPPRSPPCPSPRLSPCPPPKPPPCVSPPRRAQSPRRTQSPVCPPKPQCPSPRPCPPRNCPSPCPPVCPPNCPSWQKGQKSRKSFSPQQSQSCSDLSNESSSARQCDKIRPISSDSKVPTACVDQKMLFSAIENLCNTVGQLSNQLRDLMCKIQAGLAQ